MSRANPARLPGPHIRLEWSPGPPDFLFLFDRDRLIGGMSIAPQPRRFPKGMRTSGVAAEPGWGPLLYDTAALISSLRGLPLVADTDTSAKAQKVWQKYRSRSDVEVVPRDPSLPPSPVAWGVHMAPESFAQRWGVQPPDWLAHTIEFGDMPTQDHKNLYFRLGGLP
jgi:hypothetical protein